MPKKSLLTTLLAASMTLLAACAPSDPSSPSSPTDDPTTNNALAVLAPGSSSTSDRAPAVTFQVYGGVVAYQVTYGNEIVSFGNRLGFDTNYGDFSYGLTMEGDPVHSSGTSEYDLHGKKNHVRADYNQIDLKFSSAFHSDYFLNVQARTYAEGVGIRLGLSSRNNTTRTSFKIDDEHFGISLPTDVDVWAQNTNGNSNDSAEYTYNPYRMNEVASGQQFNFPMLYALDDQGTNVLISEANVMTGKFHASVVEKRDSDGFGNFDVTFTPESSYNNYWALDANGNFEMRRDPIDPRVDVSIAEEDFWAPWRFFTIGDLNAIANQTMGENLSDPMDPTLFQDTSYIQPGSVTWTWLNGDLRHDQIPAGQFQTLGLQIYKKYVDFAAENGWGYQLLDEGWQPLARSWTEAEKQTMTGYDPTAVEEDSRQYLGYYSWMPELIEYARQKNVKLLVWVPYNDLGTAKERERLREWYDMGLAGIKPDFFNNARQGVMKVVYELLKDTARYKMLLNLHGISKPAGERRTFPNAITREAVGGDEGYWLSGSTIKDLGVGPYQNTILPFIRYAIGPGDYTPVASFGAPEGQVDPNQIITADNTPNASPSAYNRRQAGVNLLPTETLPHQYAKAVVFESPLNTLADKPFAYKASQSVNDNWWKKLPAAFDESVVLDGRLGEIASVARRKGDDWFIGTLSSYDRNTTGSDYQNYTVDFSKIVKPGERYRAYVWSDNEDAPTLKTSLSFANAYKPAEFVKGIKEQVIEVDSTSKLDLKLASVVVGPSSGWTGATELMTTCGGAIIHLEKIA